LRQGQTSGKKSRFRAIIFPVLRLGEMQPVNNRLHRLLLVFSSLFSLTAGAQMVTGVWEGRIDKKKVEVKIIQKGDSLTGTAYYYESPANYRRYTIRGYFDEQNNNVVWWDDQLITDKGSGLSKRPLLSEASFNCPGGGEMHLDGKASDHNRPRGEVHLTKVPDPSFPDEWDFVIDNYTVGANDPDIIDSVALIAALPVPEPEVVVEAKRPEPVVEKRIPPVTRTEPPPPVPSEPVIAAKPMTIEEKFTSRKKVLTTEIPLEGDSVELRFYDNAQVDGDSIYLFLNNRMLFTHVRLTEKAYTIKLPVSEMQDSNELIMVAENLGSIPPNTSYMLAIVGDKRYDATLASTEQSSAMIRLKKPQEAVR
jgi:hypothetical protein